VSFAACLLTLAAAPDAALAVIVPDDWPTIQEAIDSGALEVLVRPGVYPETLAINRPIDLKGLVPYGTSADSLPVIAGLVFEDFVGEQIHSKYIHVWSLRFVSPIRNHFTWSPFWNPLEIEVAGCALDQGWMDDYTAARGQIEYFLRRCTVDGPVRAVSPELLYLEDCSLRAPIHVPYYLTLNVYRCDFKGPSVYAIDMRGGECRIEQSRFEGFETPIRHGEAGYPGVVAAYNAFVGPGVVPVRVADDGELGFGGNRVTGFDFGVLVPGRGGSLSAGRNIIEDCRTGIRAEVDYATVYQNTIRSCGTGVTLNAVSGVLVTDNVVRECGGDGMVIDAGNAMVKSNIVGMCEGAGFRLTNTNAYSNDSRFTANTSYRNGGSGIVVVLPDPNPVWKIERNVALENVGHALEYTGPGSIQLGCNDWFGNVAGAVSGAQPGATDLALDPLFCDVAQGDVRLSALSPLLNAAGCGQIGALGQGCDAAIVCRLVTFAATPTVEGIEVRWQVADVAPGFVAWLERSEAADGPWARVQCERSSDGDVTVESDRTAEPALAYWYRLVATDRGLTRVLGEPIRVETPPPTRFALLRTGSNPSPGPVEVAFQLAHAAEITLELYDTQGRRVATLARGSWPAGIHRANWAGARPASGVYLVRYRHPAGEDLRRIAVVR
jgi:hypothetical protein